MVPETASSCPPMPPKSGAGRGPLGGRSKRQWRRKSKHYSRSMRELITRGRPHASLRSALRRPRGTPTSNA
jgi:hypothetical protein